MESIHDFYVFLYIKETFPQTPDYYLFIHFVIYIYLTLFNFLYGQHSFLIKDHQSIFPSNISVNLFSIRSQFFFQFRSFQ